jgi:hypothetical protein
MARNTSITLPTGKRVKYKEDPEGYSSAAAWDIKRMMGKRLGIFGRERKRQERFLRAGELLGMMPERAAKATYQKAFPYTLKSANEMEKDMLKVALPNGKVIELEKSAAGTVFGPKAVTMGPHPQMPSPRPGGPRLSLRNALLGVSGLGLTESLRRRMTKRKRKKKKRKKR